MNKSETIGALAKALVKFQSSVGKVKKDTKNPFFKSDYASLANILDVIQTPLADAGLAFSQFPDGEETLTTILIHAESGEYMEAAFPMHAAKKDPQGIGSAITYARRYALGAVLGLNIDKDDDGNAASGNGQAQSTPQPRNDNETVEAIAKLSVAKSEEDVIAFAKSLPVNIKGNPAFRKAADNRIKELVG